MRILPTNNGASWRQQKEQGRDHFLAERYSEALSSYRAALASDPPRYERQMILSNIVACRLKIGGDAQISAALEEARQCIELNERWAKGHIRLASVYIAQNRSNDACNSLQRAITLDPTNQNARSMLTRELRRDRVQQQRQQQTTTAPSSSPSPPQQQPNDYNENENDVDETSLRDEFLQWFRFQSDRLRSVHENLGNDAKSILKVFLVLIILYVAFGGRFGLESSHQRHPRGHYGTDNAYDRHHNDYHRSQYDYQRRTTTEDYYTPRQSTTTSSVHFPDLFDGSIPSLMCIFAILYFAHKYGGIQPFQALWMLNVMNPGRRRGYGRGFGMHHFGGGGFGLGRGFGRGFNRRY